MQWIRLDTNFLRHPKVLALLGDGNDRAVVAWIAGLAYSGEHGLGGLVPAEALPVIRGDRRTAEALVKAGLWRRDRRGWRIHDWGAYNASSDTHAARRLAGQRSACKRWHAPGCDCTGSVVKPVQAEAAQP